MSIRSLKERFKRLQRGKLRWVVALVGTIEQSIRNFSPVLISVDKEGDWYNRRCGITLVSPELNVASWDAVHSTVMDLWCHRHKLQAGETVIDIGAGIGDDVVAFSRLVGKEGRVIAIEAHPVTYRCLEKTIAANHLDNVIAVNAAVSDTEGYLTISDEVNFLSNSIQVGTGTRKVEARTLENILKDTGSMRSDFIKMNIEGAETAALKGMEEVLRGTTNIVVSCHDFKADRGEGDFFRTYDDVSEILVGSGYDLTGRKEDPRPEDGVVYGHTVDSRLEGYKPYGKLIEYSTDHPPPQRWLVADTCQRDYKSWVNLIGLLQGGMHFKGLKY